jgi:hypothetical protein
MLDLPGVAAHYAISSFFDGYEQSDSIYSYEASLRDVSILESDDAKLAAGLVEIRSRITHAQLDFNFAVLHAGGHHLRAGVCEAHADFSEFIEQACLRISESGVNGGLRALDHYFGDEVYSLKSLFRDERKRIVGRIVDGTLADIDKLYADVYEQNLTLIDFLRDLAMPLPPILRVSSEFVLKNEIRRVLSNEKLECDRLQRLLESATQKGIADEGSISAALRERLDRTMNRWAIDPFDMQTLSELEILISLIRVVSVEADLWQAQNTYYELMKVIAPLKPESIGDESFELFRRLGHSLGIAVPEKAPANVEKKVQVFLRRKLELQLAASADS